MTELFLGVLLLLLPGHAVSFSVLNQQPSSPSSVVVVGGGPVGLAAALVLAKPPHNCRVTVLEKQSKRDGKAAGPAVYDPTRSFLYNVNPRGLLWFDRLAAADSSSTLLKRFMAIGSAPEQGTGQLITVPADPDVLIPVQKGLSAISGNIVPPNQRSYWVPRHQMMQVLQEECVIHTLANPSTPITLEHDKSVESVNVETDDSVMVRCSDGENYTARLVVAGDGVDSSVRSCLAQATQRGWVQHEPKQFEPKRFHSPSTGLKLKALQFPPNFSLQQTDGSDYATESECMYVIRSKYTDPKRYLSIGFLPVKDRSLNRPGNCASRPSHVLWTLKTGPEAKAWFQDAFPRVPWDTLIDDAEWERFATARGTTFPYCQYTAGSAAWTTSAGVVLAGDACHAFPPDIGQGINSGLQDVVALDQALKGQHISTAVPPVDEEVGSNMTLSRALELYQENRAPEHKALVRLARFGAPYQYRQPDYIDRIGRQLWTFNIVLRTMLSKIFKTPAAAMIMTMQRRDLSFQEIMRRAERVTTGLKAATLLTAWGLFCLFRKIMAAKIVV